MAAPGSPGVHAYLFPLAEVSRGWRIDVGIVDPVRLAPSLTAEQMRAVRWNALIEVKFMGNSPGWEFAAANPAEIGRDLEKLARLRAFCDQAVVIVLEEVPPLPADHAEDLTRIAPEVELRFVRGLGSTG